MKSFDFVFLWICRNLLEFLLLELIRIWNKMENFSRDEGSNTIRILVATDCHLGYMEKDEVRRHDSFQAFEEICSIAEKKQAKMISLLHLVWQIAFIHSPVNCFDTLWQSSMVCLPKMAKLSIRFCWNLVHTWEDLFLPMSCCSIETWNHASQTNRITSNGRCFHDFVSSSSQFLYSRFFFFENGNSSIKEKRH